LELFVKVTGNQFSETHRIYYSMDFLQRTCIKPFHATVSTDLKPVYRRLANAGCNSCHFVEWAGRSHVRHEGGDAQLRCCSGWWIDAVKSQNVIDRFDVAVFNERPEPLMNVAYVLRLKPVA